MIGTGIDYDIEGIRRLGAKGVQWVEAGSDFSYILETAHSMIKTLR